MCDIYVGLGTVSGGRVGCLVGGCEGFGGGLGVGDGTCYR